MRTTFLASTDLTTIECGMCGGIYAIGERYRIEQERLAQCWNCPYCKCSWGYPGKSEAQKLREQLTRKQAEIDQAKATNRDLSEQVTKGQRRLSAQRGVNTILKKRIATGKCPCCHEQFTDVAAHMKQQHPDYAAQPITE